MLLNKALVAQVKDRMSDTSNVTPFSPEILKRLDDAAGEFVLAPDEYIDVARLPGTVVDLDTLFAYLKTVQGKLSTRDNKVKTEDSEVAKSGELRCYKLYVCSIHAVLGYVKTSPDFNKLPVAFCNDIAVWASKNPPDGLGKNGTTLWNKTFGEPNPRVLAVLKSLIFFCDKAAAAPTTVTDSASLAVIPQPPVGGLPPSSVIAGAIVQSATSDDDEAMVDAISE